MTAIGNSSEIEWKAADYTIDRYELITKGKQEDGFIQKGVNAVNEWLSKSKDEDASCQVMIILVFTWNCT